MSFLDINFVLQLKKQMIMDNIKPGRHQEVIRKIHEWSIDKGYLSLDYYQNM